MSILDINVMTVLGQNLIISDLALFSSILVNLYQLYREIRYRRFKNQKADEEILEAAYIPIAEKTIHSVLSISDIKDAIAEKYKLTKWSKKKLCKIETVYKFCKVHINKNRLFTQEDKDKLFKLIDAEKNSVVQINRREPIESLRKAPEKGEEKKEESKERDISVESKVYFSDDFTEITGWRDYRQGIVRLSSDFHHSGKSCLKKDLNEDPHGGFKLIGGHVSLEESREIRFTGWMYRPLVASPNLGDRLALEAADFCGYGFCVAHNSNNVWIERRVNGDPKLISTKYSFNPPKNEWYNFEFRMQKGGKFRVLIFDKKGGIAVDLSSFIDDRYLFFTQVAVHGGFPYYVDDLKIEVIE